MTSFLAVVAIGFTALFGQVVLLREAGIAFQGNEIAHALGAGAWLLGATLGIAHRERGGLRLGVGGALAALGWSLVPLVVVARGLPADLRGGAGGEPDLPRLLVGVAVVLGPAGFLAGAALRKVTRERRRCGAPATRTWAAACAGAVMGGAAATLGPALGVGGLAAAFAGALIASMGRRRGVAGALAAVALVGLFVAGAADVRLTRWTHAGLLATAETMHGRVTVERRNDGLAVFVDDALAYENQGTTAEEFAALAALQRATPGDVLVLGGWIEGLAAELAPYGSRRLESVEIDGTPLRLAAEHLERRVPLAEVVVADPRRYLAGSRRYDLILSALPEPSTGRANRHASAEFFAQCAVALGDSGVLAIRLRTAANVWTPRQAHRAAGLYAALLSVFADVVVLPGTETVFLASAAPLTRDVDVLAARLARAAPDTRVVSGGWLDWRYRNERTAEVGRLLRQATVPANRDSRPGCYADAIMLDLAHLFPGLGWHSPPAAGRWLWFALAVLLPPVVIARRRAGASRNVFAAYAGLAGAGMTIILLLHDQAARPYLYRDLGALLAVGAAGVAIGLGAGGRYANRPAPRWRRPALAAAFSLWNCVTAFGLLGGGSGLPFTAAGLLGTGILVGLLLAAAVADVDDDTGAALGAAAAGGCLGSTLAALLLVPFAGLPAAGLAFAVLAFPAAIAVWPPATASSA